MALNATVILTNDIHKQTKLNYIVVSIVFFKAKKVSLKVHRSLSRSLRNPCPRVKRVKSALIISGGDYVQGKNTDAVTITTLVYQPSKSQLIDLRSSSRPDDSHYFAPLNPLVLPILS